MKAKKIIILLIAFLLVLTAFVSCEDDFVPPTPEAIDLNDAIEHESTTSVYDEIGSKITIDMVEERDGMAFVTYENVEYELGMDFLSMAMVYNCTVPANHDKYKSAADVYDEWWKLYIQRWNYLCPEIPLYSNIYYDLYNAKIEGLVTTPYWGPESAIIASTVKTADNSVILGSSTELSGNFRNSSWGKSSPAASDLDVQELTSGYATVQADKNGQLIWNMQALAAVPQDTVNADGTLTYTIEVRDDMVFSDGSAIKAENYIAGILCNASVVGMAAGGTGTSGTTIIGYKEYKAYDGTGEKVYFEGIKLIDEYTFSVTFTAEYAGYFYAMNNAGFSPDPIALYLGSASIVTDADGCVAPSDEFYAYTTEGEAKTYTQAATIVNNLKWNSALPYSGPYTVFNYDEGSQVATMKLNPLYPGDDARGQASIETITYVEVVAETQMDQFTTGQVDIIAGITGGTETEAALAVVNADPDKYAETHYDRAGYGKLGMRCDFGPTGLIEVRQAIMYMINRPQFAQDFTGGHGSVVHGPYYTGFGSYKAVEDDIELNTYSYSADSALDVLVDAGWIYNQYGQAFRPGTDEVRFKKLSGYELSKDNLQFVATDSSYRTVKYNGEYFMPLVINYYGTQPNEVTDQLLTAWVGANAATEIGMKIIYTSTTFQVGLYGELFRLESYGYDGVPKLNAINFATGFNSAIYDFAFNWSINPAYFDDYSTAYIKDEADFFENY